VPRPFFPRVPQAYKASHTLDGRELKLNLATPEKVEGPQNPPELVSPLFSTKEINKEGEVALNRLCVVVQVKRLFVGELRTSVTDIMLRDACETFGQVEDVVIMKNPETVDTRRQAGLLSHPCSRPVSRPSSRASRAGSGS
jgi:hypothetical protein